MKKNEFLAQLHLRLAHLPQADIKRCLDFCTEMIEDRIEEGLGEEAAVRAIGSPDEIANILLSELGYPQRRSEKSNGRRSPLVILLLVLGFPLWFPLLIAAAVVLLAVYILLFALLLAAFAVAISLAAAGIFGIFYSFFVLFLGGTLGTLLFYLGGGIFAAGAAVLSFIGCKHTCTGVWYLCNRIPRGIRNCFSRKERHA